MNLRNIYFLKRFYLRERENERGAREEGQGEANSLLSRRHFREISN